jgi:hypothetical protein
MINSSVTWPEIKVHKQPANLNNPKDTGNFRGLIPVVKSNSFLEWVLSPEKMQTIDQVRKKTLYNLFDWYNVKLASLAKSAAK